jgi:hypothetical protein
MIWKDEKKQWPPSVLVVVVLGSGNQKQQQSAKDIEDYPQPSLSVDLPSLVANSDLRTTTEAEAITLH